jgi:flagellar hook-associated protein 3 FlgL
MRVTQQMRLDAGMSALRENSAAMEKLRLQIATGRRILEPQDDPQGVEKSLVTRTYLGVVRGVLRNLDVSENWMDASTSALNQFAKVLGSAQVRGLQALNDTQGPTERRAIAAEVREVLSQALDAANADENSLHLFAGHQVNAAPFVLDEVTLQVTYQGDNGAIRHEVEPGRTMEVNVTGASVGGIPSFFATGFDGLRKLYTGLMNNDSAEMRAGLDEIERAGDGAMEQSAVLGNRVRAVRDSRDRLQNFEVDLESRISGIEHVDEAEAAVQLASAQQQYNATLVNLSQNLLTSLFDYLR